MGRYSWHKDRDRIFNGHDLFRRLIRSNFVLTPSGLVRKACYDKISYFDLGMPWCGDWFLWCLFALHHDVAYLSEPMLCYREHHDLSMTSQLTTRKLDACATEEIAVPWTIREKALQAGYARVARECLIGAALAYSRTLASKRFRDSSRFMNFGLFEESLATHTESSVDRDFVRAHTLLGVGNEYYWQGEHELAKRFYGEALRENRWMMTARFKSMLLSLGKRGELVRKAILAFR
jgi:hypothetical protein